MMNTFLKKITITALLTFLVFAMATPGASAKTKCCYDEPGEGGGHTGYCV